MEGGRKGGREGGREGGEREGGRGRERKKEGGRERKKESIIVLNFQQFRDGTHLVAVHLRPCSDTRPVRLLLSAPHSHPGK